jgi:hypothetical protein
LLRLGCPKQAFAKIATPRSNTLYIAETQLEQFKTEFDHAETECGNCHKGKAWMGQIGGHILRRLVGRRWNNQENNQMCIDCHGDSEKMRDVEQEDPETKEKHPPSERFIHSADTYAKTLHGRLIVDDSAWGASCIDCHAPDGWKHEIRSYTDPESASHPDNLPETCGQSNCHGYTKKPGNEGFTMTDMHDVSLLGLTKMENPFKVDAVLDSKWLWSSWPLLLIGLVFIFCSAGWWFLYRNTKKIIPIVGGDRFERVMVGRKPKSARKKAAARTTKPRAKMADKVVPKTESADKTFIQSSTAQSKQVQDSVAAAQKADKPVASGENRPESTGSDKVETQQEKPDNDQDNKGG